MIETLLTKNEDNSPLWINLFDPTEQEMEEIATKFNLHPELVHDCLGPFHLPKHEINNKITFLVIRSFNSESAKNSNSAQEMTNKMAFFLGNRFLITFQRHEHEFIYDIAKEYSNLEDDELFIQKLVLELIHVAVETYKQPLEEMEDTCENFEQIILKGDTNLKWENIFNTKSRLMAIKRILVHTQNAIKKFIPNTNTHLPLYQNLVEEVDGLIFLTDTISDDLTNLLNIQLSLSAQKTNEVMRVLTVFSVFFMPLTFIVGIYGMNFKFMPELDYKFGYFIVLLIMALITLAFFAWFKKRKWL